MATFQEIKNKVHDGSGCKNPDHCSWELRNNVWYPAIDSFDFETQKYLLRQQYEQSGAQLTFAQFVRKQTEKPMFYQWFFRIEVDDPIHLPDNLKELWADYLLESFWQA